MGLLGKFFGQSAEPVLGVDISSSAVKVLELSRRGDAFSVEAFGIEGLPATAVVDKQVVETEAVAEAITKAIGRSGSKLKKAAVAVSGSAVITKVIQMSSDLSDADLEDQIRVEADQYIPYSVEDVNLDFQIIGPNAASPEDTNDVMLAACRTDTIETRMSALELAGIIPWVIDIEAFALENACQLLLPQLPDNGADQTIAVVDLGSSGTSMLILHDGEVTYTRDQQFGGRQLTEDIMRHYGMSWEEAGKAKRLGNLPEDYATAVLGPFIEDAAQQIDRALQFYFSSAGAANQIDRVLLAGGTANIPELDQRIGQRLEITTETARPLAQLGVTGKAKPQQVTRDETAMLIAAGLALRSFDGV